MTDRDRVVAIGLLTQRDLDMLGDGLRHVYRVDESRKFDDLLLAIDEAMSASGDAAGKRSD
jgi:hypothetical protein